MPARYGFWNFVLDVLMLALLGPVWVVWIIIRQCRKGH